MKRYNFDRYRNGCLMAEGARTIANSLEEALAKVHARYSSREDKGTTFELSAFDYPVLLARCKPWLIDNLRVMFDRQAIVFEGTEIETHYRKQITELDALLSEIDRVEVG